MMAQAGWQGRAGEADALERSGPPHGFAIAHGPITLDLIARSGWRGGRPVRLTPIEFSLLACLIRAGGEPVSRPALLRAVWHLHFNPGTKLVEVHLSRLRAKLDRGAPSPAIETVRGEGYRVAGG